MGDRIILPRKSTDEDVEDELLGDLLSGRLSDVSVNSVTAIREVREGGNGE